MARTLSRVVPLSGNDWIEVDLSRNHAIINGEAVHFAPLMNAMLSVFVAHRGHVVTYHQIMHGVWGGQEPKDVLVAMRDMIRRLRRALEPRGYQIVNYLQSGYELVRATSHAPATNTVQARAPSHRA
jgi:DNA-binding response OmpR family regulator